MESIVRTVTMVFSGTVTVTGCAGGEAAGFAPGRRGGGGLGPSRWCSRCFKVVFPRRDRHVDLIVYLIIVTPFSSVAIL